MGPCGKAAPGHEDSNHTSSCSCYFAISHKLLLSVCVRKKKTVGLLLNRALDSYYADTEAGVLAPTRHARHRRRRGSSPNAGGWVARSPPRCARAERRRWGQTKEVSLSAMARGVAATSPDAGGWVDAAAHLPSRHAAFSSMEDSWTTYRPGGRDRSAFWTKTWPQRLRPCSGSMRG
jgi:hypothetical protein